MSKPYLIISDLHCHSWSAFSTTLKSGVNSRLQIIIDEIHRAADTLGELGGNTIVMAGDLFHTRGSIDPEVFNPVNDCIKMLQGLGFRIYAIPGNHDLKGKETTLLGNAFLSLDAPDDGFHVISRPIALTLEDARGDVELRLAFVPWNPTVEGLLADIQEVAEMMNRDALANTDLIIHAGIDGVVPGLPDHGLTAAKLQAFGFRRVFAGHYHHHKAMGDFDKVVSIGALTHQTWSDIGAKAGFLIVQGGELKTDQKPFVYHASHAPEFIEVNAETDEEDIALLVDGNYVRVSGLKLTDAEVNAMRKELMELGAKGVVFQITREAVSARGPGASTKGLTIDASVNKYISDLEAAAKAEGETDLAHFAAAGKECADILTKIQSVDA